MQSDIPTISLVSSGSCFWLALLENFCILPRLLSLHSSASAAAQLSQPRLLWAWRTQADQLREHTDSLLLLWNVVLSGHSSTQDCHCQEAVKEPCGTHSQPRIARRYGPGVLQSQHCPMALGWPCNTVTTAHTGKKSQTGYESPPETAYKSQESLFGKWHSHLHQETSRLLVFPKKYT